MKRVDVLKGVAGNGDQVCREPGADRSTRLFGLTHQEAICGHGAEDIRVRDFRRFPRLDELDRDFASGHSRPLPPYHFILARNAPMRQELGRERAVSAHMRTRDRGYAVGADSDD